MKLVRAIPLVFSLWPVTGLNAQTFRKYDLSWPKEAVRSACGQRTIEVVVESDQGVTWLLAAEGNAAPGTLSAAAVVQIPLADFKTGAQPYRATNGLISFVGPCRLVLNAGLARGNVILAHIWVPKGSTLATYRGQTLSTQVSVTPGVLLAGERLLTNDGRLHVLRSHGLLAGGTVGPNKEIVKDSRGQVHITPFGWRTHIIETDGLPFASGLKAKCCESLPRMYHVQVEVGVNGEVQSVRSVNVPSELESSVLGLVSSMKVRQFANGSTPVAAKGTLVLLRDKAGRVFLAY